MKRRRKKKVRTKFDRMKSLEEFVREQVSTLIDLTHRIGKLEEFKDTLLRTLMESKLNVILPAVDRLGYGNEENPRGKAPFLKPTLETETSNPKFSIGGPDSGKDGGKL